MTDIPTENGARPTYAEILYRHTYTANNPTGAPLSIRQLARLTGYSYEHIRKLVNGEPVASEDANRAVCQALGLDTQAMWELACREKLSRQARHYRLPAPPPADPRMVRLWPLVSREDQETLIHIAEAFVKGRKADGAEDARQVMAAATEQPDAAREGYCVTLFGPETQDVIACGSFARAEQVVAELFRTNGEEMGAPFEITSSRRQWTLKGHNVSIWYRDILS